MSSSLTKFKTIVKRSAMLTVIYRDFRDYLILHRKPKMCSHGYPMIGTQEMVGGTFEPDETRYCLDTFASIDAVVNVGANYGYYTLLARSHGKQVIAFEPHPWNYRVLCRNLELNGWYDLEVYPVAVADQAGMLRIYGSGTGASLIPGWASSHRGHYCLVPVTTLDRVIGNELRGKKVFFIIDVEGAELRVLKGAMQQLVCLPAPVWFIEISITGHQPTGVVVNPNLMETFQLFWSFGYQAFLLSGGFPEITADVVKNWIRQPGMLQGGNFVFKKPTKPYNHLLSGISA